ncbi:tRNA threonylcarbamoyladenosine biosynthesis protein RimN [Rheinheimera sp. KL1]|uniref:Sua5/YciO/YrdC/YwlC family protein n=1 Tax=Rheinheimera sp. KL1 TaxID=1635005 RepID=UPI0006A996DA|nr:Sua5/YciO/YrdC/YwlC family protein [Rheinheimera sp. KL1]KOO58819.1 tRNA threonylcarbamoyladenosine biosynthesis protein RimN [Rheinheimera sp. KL1]
MTEIPSAVTALRQGQVIAYPTEAVFGVGCDPDNHLAIETLLQVKQRPKSKGLILIAADFSQLIPYIAADQLSLEQTQLMLDSWRNSAGVRDKAAVTWVVPASARCSDWLTGQFDSIAIRVCDHSVVQQLCLAFGKPITSTSANLSGLEPCRSAAEVRQQLADKVAVIVDAPTGGRAVPSEIRDITTGHIYRAGA